MALTIPKILRQFKADEKNREEKPGRSGFFCHEQVPMLAFEGSSFPWAAGGVKAGFQTQMCGGPFHPLGPTVRNTAPQGGKLAFRMRGLNVL